MAWIRWWIRIVQCCLAEFAQDLFVGANVLMTDGLGLIGSNLAMHLNIVRTRRTS